MTDKQNEQTDPMLSAMEGMTSALSAIGDRLDATDAQIKALADQPINSVPIQAPIEAPMINAKTKLGDDETKALAYYIRTADKGALLKASTDDITSIAVDANAGYAVPVGHYQGIIEKRNETPGLRDALGLTMIPGVGTTVNVTTDAAGDGLFVTTGEQIADHSVSFDRDTPPVGQVQMTLVKKTKKVELTDEILQDEDSNLLAFVEAYIGRGLQNTWSNEIVTNALADGTAALTLDGGTAITKEEVPELYYLLPDGYEANASWVMRRSTEALIRSISGEMFNFMPNPMGNGPATKELWSAPLYTTQYMPAVALSAKTLLLGDFAYMGYREAPGLTMIADPYSVDGAVILKYYTRMVVKTLIPEAIIYATQAAA